MYMGEISCILVEVFTSKNKEAGFTDVFVKADVKKRTEGEVCKIIQRQSNTQTHTHTHTHIHSCGIVISFSRLCEVSYMLWLLQTILQRYYL